MASRILRSETKGFPQVGFFSPLLCFSSLHALSGSLRRSPDENFTNHLRINRDSDNTTANSPFTATGATRGPKRHRGTPAMNTSACVSSNWELPMCFPKQVNKTAAWTYFSCCFLKWTRCLVGGLMYLVSLDVEEFCKKRKEEEGKKSCNRWCVNPIAAQKTQHV